MILAGITDYFGYGFTMVILMGVPAAGLVINITGMKRQGLNKRAAYAAALFFFTLLIQGTTVTLSRKDGFSEETEFAIIAGTAVLNALGALMSLWALYQVRRKHRWPRGRKRAIVTFWLNILALGVIGFAYFLRTRPDLEERIFG